MSTGITDILGISTKGQKSMAESLPVVLPSDQTIELTLGDITVTDVALDQTTPGTTESVTVKASAGIGSLTETAPATDTASSGLNGRLQRIAQRITSLIALIPASLGQKAMAASMAVVVASDQSEIPVSAAQLPAALGSAASAASLPVVVASDQGPVASKIDQTTPGTTDSVTVKASVGIGSLTETAPSTDTASSGLNGRLQRIAQRLTSLIALIPASLGQKAMAASLAVTIASDQSAVPSSHGKTLLCVAGAAGNSGNNTIIAAPGAGAIYVYGYALQAIAGSVNAKLQDGASGTDKTLLWTMQVRDGASRQVTPPGYLFKLTATTLLNLNLSGATAVAYEINYWVE